MIITYTCQHMHTTVTIRRGKGTVPFQINCRAAGCGQPSFAAPESEDDKGLTPTYEWYVPLHPERYVYPQMREHVRSGGLVLRQIGGPDETLTMKPQPITKDFGKFSSLAQRALTNAHNKPKVVKLRGMVGLDSVSDKIADLPDQERIYIERDGQYVEVAEDELPEDECGFNIIHNGLDKPVVNKNQPSQP